MEQSNNRQVTAEERRYYARRLCLEVDSAVEMVINAGYVIEGVVHDVLWDLRSLKPVAVVIKCPGVYHKRVVMLSQVTEIRVPYVDPEETNVT